MDSGASTSGQQQSQEQQQQQGAAAAAGGPSTTPKKLPRPHRCNDRVEDLIQALYSLEYKAKINPAWTQLMACLRSEPGSEPQGGHVCIKDPSLFLDPHKMHRPRKEQ